MHYVGIITAYAAVAVLAWLAALLQPTLLPSADARSLDRRWWAVGQFAIALLGITALNMLDNRGWLLPERGPWLAVVTEMLIFLPILAYIAAQRSCAAALVPARGVPQSLVTGIALALIALLTYLLALNSVGRIPQAVGGLFSMDNLAPAVGLVMQDIAIAALLALIADGWSRRVSLICALAVFAAIHVPFMFAGGVQAGEVVAALTNAAVVAGIVSSILVTRNLLWFLPAHIVLALAPLADS